MLTVHYLACRAIIAPSVQFEEKVVYAAINFSKGCQLWKLFLTSQITQVSKVDRKANDKVSPHSLTTKFSSNTECKSLLKHEEENNVIPKLHFITCVLMMVFLFQEHEFPKSKWWLKTLF